jgi:hypothetical protein
MLKALSSFPCPFSLFLAFSVPDFKCPCNCVPTFSTYNFLYRRKPSPSDVIACRFLGVSLSLSSDVHLNTHLSPLSFSPLPFSQKMANRRGSQTIFDHLDDATMLRVLPDSLTQTYSASAPPSLPPLGVCLSLSLSLSSLSSLIRSGRETDGMDVLW